MKKNIYCLALFLFISFLFSNCDEEEPINPNGTNEASEAARRSGPVANAGSDVSLILPVGSIVLDGSESRTYDGITKYQWSKTAGPVSGSITDPASATTLVSGLTKGSYTFSLTITDSKDRASTDQVTVTLKGDTVSVPPSSSLTDLYFAGNMNNVSITASGSNFLFNGWDQLKNNEYIENIELNNIGGTSYVYQQIKPDPTSSSINTMYATILDDDPAVSGTTRAQMSLRFRDGVDLSVYHTSHRIYLNPDIGYFQNYSSAISWFELFEIWNTHNDAWDGSVSGSARWSLYVNKDSGSGQPLYWVIKSEYMQPAALELQNIWKYTNKQIPIPLGKWVTMDLYMKRGEGSNGRLTLKITPDGGSTQVLFDITNSTVYPGHPELQIKSWQPFKLYLNDVYLDWMRANGKSISAYYNDFKWYKN